MTGMWRGALPAVARMPVSRSWSRRPNMRPMLASLKGVPAGSSTMVMALARAAP